VPDLHDWDDITDVAEFIDVTALAQQALAQVFAETQTAVDQLLIHGNGTGEPRGFLSAERISIPYSLSDDEIADHGYVVGPPEPSPAERALAILDPELRACPLYNAGPPTLRGPNWKP
jgi:hypothetical protein